MNLWSSPRPSNSPDTQTEPQISTSRSSHSGISRQSCLSLIGSSWRGSCNLSAANTEHLALPTTFPAVQLHTSYPVHLRFEKLLRAQSLHDTSARLAYQNRTEQHPRTLNLNSTFGKETQWSSSRLRTVKTVLKSKIGTMAILTTLMTFISEVLQPLLR